MPQDGNNRENGSYQMSADEYKRMQAARAERRKKRQQQRLMVLGAFVLAAILLIVCIVLVVRSIVKKKDDSTTTTSDTSISTLAQEPDYTPNYPTAADNTVWNLKLVNENNRLPADFEVDFEWGDIVVYSGDAAVPYWFDERIVDSLKQMIEDCNAVEGNSLTVGSGFRSYDRQQKYFDYEITLGNSEEDVKRYESTAGASDHHTGLAVKFVTGNVSEFSETFATTPEYQWLLENAENYGFILRYPGAKEAITGMDFMPYHWRYVGVDDAKTMNASGVCLEEYVSAVSSSVVANQAAQPDDPDNGADGGPVSGAQDDPGAESGEEPAADDAGAESGTEEEG